MKTLAWITIVITVLGGLNILAELVTGYDVETNVFALAYMALIVYVVWPQTQK